jgi:hypothetical protein
MKKISLMDGQPYLQKVITLSKKLKKGSTRIGQGLH